MKKMFLVFTLGVLGGSAAGSWYGQRHFSKLAAERISAAATRAKKLYGIALGLERPKAEKLAKKNEAEPEYTREERIEYINLVHGYGEINTDRLRAIEKHMAERESPTELQPEPYEITCQLFSETMNHYDKILATYYLGDNVLVDEEEEAIPPDYVGCAAYDLIAEARNSDDPFIYIRNDKRSTDYEIRLVNCSWIDFDDPNCFS